MTLSIEEQIKIIKTIMPQPETVWEILEAQSKREARVFSFDLRPFKGE